MKTKRYLTTEDFSVGDIGKHAFLRAVGFYNSGYAGYVVPAIIMFLGMLISGCYWTFNLQHPGNHGYYIDEMAILFSYCVVAVVVNGILEWFYASDTDETSIKWCLSSAKSDGTRVFLRLMWAALTTTLYVVMLSMMDMWVVFCQVGDIDPLTVERNIIPWYDAALIYFIAIVWVPLCCSDKIEDTYTAIQTTITQKILCLNKVSDISFITIMDPAVVRIDTTTIPIVMPRAPFIYVCYASELRDVLSMRRNSYRTSEVSYIFVVRDMKRKKLKNIIKEGEYYGPVAEVYIYDVHMKALVSAIIKFLNGDQDLIEKMYVSEKVACEKSALSRYLNRKGVKAILERDRKRAEESQEASVTLYNNTEESQDQPDIEQIAEESQGDPSTDMDTIYNGLKEDKSDEDQSTSNG